MSDVNIRELRNHGGSVLDRVAAGEIVTVVRSGTAVAQLTPLRRQGLTAAELIARRRALPVVDPVDFKRDIDTVLDPFL